MPSTAGSRRRPADRRRARPTAAHGQESTGKARRRLTPEARREQILTEAIAFFVEHGVAGTTRELSARIGVTQPLLYKYFPCKRDLLEAVYDKVYLGRLKPHWAKLVADRRKSLRLRMTTFYLEYAETILTREWVRLFVFAGLQGEDLSRRYLSRLAKTVISPLRDEIKAEIDRKHSGTGTSPSMNDMWALHGGIFYFGIREHIYGLGEAKDRSRVIESTVHRFLAAYGL